MNVGINARSLTKPNPAGVSRYTLRLLVALAEQEAESDMEFILFGVEDIPTELDEYTHVRSAREPAPTHSGLTAHRWEQTTLPRALNQSEIDVFHTPAGQPPLLARVPLVTTIHDISPITHPEWFSRGYAGLYRVLTPLAVRKSERIITVSEFAREEIISEYPYAAGKTEAIYNGLTPPAETEASVDAVTEGEYLLFVGSLNKRKNLKTLLQAYEQYRTRVDDPLTLTLVGPEKSVFAETEIPVNSGVQTLGFVSDEELGWLYQNAAAFVFPSLYEGFGLPILEAMSAGTPVLTSDLGAMAEVADEAACLVSPSQPGSLAEGIELIGHDDDYRQQLIQNGCDRADAFTWERTAAQTAEIYRSVAKRNSR